MRIVVLGDFHLKENELDLTSQAIEDIHACAPDLVVPLGDFGGYAQIGSVEGLRQAYGFFSRLNAPIRPILGNHDMERETGGKGLQPTGTMQQAFLELFGLEETNGFIDTEFARLIFVGTDLQPPGSCYSDQECYVTDVNYENMQRWINEAGDKPVFMFTHAPIAGSGLRTVPQVHVRATNAYMDQNHDFDRWLKLVRQHASIKLWFSAHFHLGHDYPDSQTERHGTAFFMTGVHGTCTRDGTRMSRVIDIDESGVRIYTLDHVKRELRPVPDWSATWTRMMDRTSEVAAACSTMEAAREEDKSVDQEKATLIAECAIGEAPPHENGVIPLSPDRCLVSTLDGFLWEIAPFEEAVLGTLHLGAPLAAATVSGDNVWRAWGHTVVRCDRSSLDRFQRQRPLLEYPSMFEAPASVSALAPRSDGTVWVACGNQLFALSMHDDQAVFTLIYDFAAEIKKLIHKGHGGVCVLTEDRKVHFIDPLGKLWNTLEDVVDWDASSWDPDANACILEDGCGRSAALMTSDGRILETWPIGPSAERIVALGGRCSAWIEENACCWRDGKGNGRLPIADNIVRIDAAARLIDSGEGRPRLGLAVSSSAPHARPSLQLWEIAVEGTME